MNKHTNPKQDPFLERETKKYQTPVPSREFILLQLKKSKTPLKPRQLIDLFELSDPDLIEGINRRIKAMQRDGQIVRLKSGLVIVDKLTQAKGTLIMSKEGEGVCLTDDHQTIPIQERSLRGLYHGDKVSIQIRSFGNAKEQVGSVHEVLSPVTPTVVGHFYKYQDMLKVRPLDRKYTTHIIIPQSFKGKAKPDDIVVVKILREAQYQTHYEPMGEVIEVLGDHATSGIEVLMAIKKFNLPYIWPEAVNQACNKLPAKITAYSKRNREDLTHLGFVTIDGEDAKDFDDAVYCERHDKGWRLWVAIADVSYYVKPNTVLDKEATVRGNSTYFPEAVIPMLPEALSNHLCSLKPLEERLVLVCQMSINNEGKVTRSVFKRAVIKSQARLTYTKVAAIYDGNRALTKEYSAQIPSLKALLGVYHALNEQRKIRGALDLDTIESKIVFNDSNKIEKIVAITRNVAHKVIEECMLVTNVCAAKFILRHKRPALFRVHDSPPKEKLAHLRTFIHELGLSLKGKDKPQPLDIAALLENVKQRPDRHLLETVIMRSLSQAQYRPQNAGHFGLAYPHYVHFTSPIRRFPDLVIHRIILDVLEAKKKPSYDLEKLEKMGVHFSQTERRSDEATRDAVFALKCHYMQDKIGEIYDGVISGVTHFGIFVELKDVFVEGLIHVSQLGRDYFLYDPIKHRMIGERSRQVYQLGQTVQIKVVRVDLDERKIDFQLLDADMPAGGTQRKKGKTQAKASKKVAFKEEKTKSSSKKKKSKARKRNKKHSTK